MVIAPFARSRHGCRNLGFANIRNFNIRLCHISAKSVERLWRYHDIMAFENGRRPPSWIFILKFLTTTAAKGPILHHRAKRCKDRSSFRRDVAFFRFSYTAVAAILYFQKFVILTVGRLYKANVRHGVKFCQKSAKRLRRYRDLIDFKMAVVSHKFLKLHF